MINLEAIRSANPIEEVIGDTFTVQRRGATLTTQEHDSLVIFPESQSYYRYSRQEYGDVFDFVGRYALGYGDAWNSRDPQQFREAVAYLARRAGLAIDTESPVQISAGWALRELDRRLVQALMDHPPALNHLTHQRGLPLDVIQRARLGFMPADKASLLANLDLPENWRQIIEHFPANTVVFPHRDRGRLEYLSGRSVIDDYGQRRGPKHYKPPRDLIGPQQLFWNPSAGADCHDRLIVCEGVLDALSFETWNLPAVALGGVAYADLLPQLDRYKRVILALDSDATGQATAAEIAAQLKQRAYLIDWPDGSKDANQWLVQVQPAAAAAEALVTAVTPWLHREAERIAALSGNDRTEALRDFFQATVAMDAFDLDAFKVLCQDVLNLRSGAFNAMLKAARAAADDHEPDPVLLDETIPIIAPALGFTDDFAIVTVTLAERIDNRISHQPYLVTSQRERHRLNGDHILTVNGREIALEDIPAPSPYLMRWRQSHIQRFLNGETVDPAQVFKAVLAYVQQYIDWPATADAYVVALWTIATYFFTLFPAFPYLVLHGPKGSGKSTVLSILQPVAFNMFTTADLTGPALFRTIHDTRGTVGYDEAEIFQNRRNEHAPQLRLLLNSGYKPGMPAIRLVGDDYRPQAFNIYSPKVFATIEGIEEVLASRCIIVPMQPASRRLPSLPIDFDGADLRHQLYTLALTHFPAVRQHYFARDPLANLNNRPAELWQPLLALAALFAEAGVTEGLVDVLRAAASRDVSFSPAAPLDARQRAVLQALEWLMRGQAGVVELAAQVIREKVAELLEIPVAELGPEQWIGHRLNDLQLIDESRKRKVRGTGVVYTMDDDTVRSAMQRFGVESVSE